MGSRNSRDLNLAEPAISALSANQRDGADGVLFTRNGDLRLDGEVSRGRRPCPCERRGRTLNPTKPSKSQDQEHGELNTALPAYERGHRLDISQTRHHGKPWMRVPLPEVIEPRVVGVRALKERVECRGVVLRAADEMRGASALGVKREVHDAKMAGGDLLSHRLVTFSVFTCQEGQHGPWPDTQSQ